MSVKVGYNNIADAKENEIYITPKQPIVIEEGIGELLFKYLKKHADKTGQIDAATGEKETYGSLLSKSIRTAQNLRSKGIIPGDIISLCSYNCLEYSAVSIASYFVGSFLAPIDSSVPISDIIHCVKITSPKIIFCENDLETKIQTAVNEVGLNSEIVVFGQTKRNVPFADYLKGREPEESFEIYKETDMFNTACIHFSSGTTGLPKAVCVTHFGILYVQNVMFRERPPRVNLIAMTPFWISNNLSLIGNILLGDTRIICRQFDERIIMKYVQDYKVNILTITPVHGAKLLKHPEYYKNYDLSSLTVLGSGGSSTSPKQFQEYMQAFPNCIFVTAYGMTESGGLILQLHYQTIKDVTSADKSCVGSPIPGIRYRVVDPDTEKILGPHEEGELRFKYDGIMKEYYNNSESYAEAFDKHGFLKTGDIVTYDENYRFYYVTRIKDIFKYLGWHISPSIIEKELSNHPNVKQCVVFGVPSKTDGEYATAAVILEDKSKFNETELQKFVQERLPEKYHLRGGIYSMDNFPVTSTGKVKRRVLTEIILKLQNKL